MFMVLMSRWLRLQLNSTALSNRLAQTAVRLQFNHFFRVHIPMKFPSHDIQRKKENIQFVPGLGLVRRSTKKKEKKWKKQNIVLSTVG